MSVERELLQEVLDQSYFDKDTVMADIFNRITKLLAQPEPKSLTPRQGLEEYKRGYARAEQDLKREPLSDERIAKLWGESFSGTTQMVRTFARAIEKAHGIGE